MPGTNTYKDTEAADYLDSIRKHQAENRNANSGAAQFSPTYVLQRSNQINISNSFTNTAKTLGDYDVVNNKAYLVAYIPFQLDSNDASNANHGTWTGSETYTTGPEINATKFRKAASFNGSSYVTLANESNFDFEYTNAFSISLWIKSSVTGTAQDLITKQNGQTAVGWRIGITSSNTVNFILKTASTSYTVTATSTPNDGVYHSIIATYSGNSNQSGMKIYFDGVLENTGTSSAIASTILNNISVIIGASGDTTRKLTGQVVECRIWNSELSSTDVTDLYHGKQINKDTAATNPAIIGLSDIA